MLLQLRGVSKAFGAVIVADAIDLDVEVGEALGIICPNGAGKSSLFNLITGNLQPDAGEIRLDGVQVTRLPARQRCGMGLGRSFQIPRPFETMTVFENLAVAACYGGGQREAEGTGHCVDVLRRTGLLAKANLPAGSLSLLERKRLEMARALATRPRLLLLDEIAGGLTEGECQELVAAIRDVHASGVTIIWIEHVVHALLAVVARLAALDFGKVIAEGRPDQVMASDEVKRIYLGVE
jgi:branched-chain amino acid transport system ATP-binding protein